MFAQRSAMAVPNGRGRHEHGGNRSSSRRSVTSSSLKHRSNLYELLAEPCVRALMMCLQTQRDFEELPAESAASLRDSLVKLFIQYGAGPRTVRMQLCVAIASLARARALRSIWRRRCHWLAVCQASARQLSQRCSHVHVGAARGAASGVLASSGRLTAALHAQCSAARRGEHILGRRLLAKAFTAMSSMCTSSFPGMCSRWRR